MPKSAYEDSLYLGWDIRKYHIMAEMLANNCFQNKFGDWCSIPKAKKKKLKNIRAMIRKDSHLSQSMIMREYCHLLDRKIKKRNAPKQ